MPVVILFACLDLEQKSSFLDGLYRTVFKIQSALLVIKPGERFFI